MSLWHSVQLPWLHDSSIMLWVSLGFGLGLFDFFFPHTQQVIKLASETGRLGVVSGPEFT